ncbi:hypothetical protein HPB52_012984 [Rhipicephalus sanguineus]|uniref:Tick transposon n=1 Tax=Rhipicephalus sanguineus TaxID=34632 RepID=A0A9D4SW97_RHISA|nr:hypothetical protein HPB52_012984 [Rhipicephalus sanguineus]
MPHRPADRDSGLHSSDAWFLYLTQGVTPRSTGTVRTLFAFLQPRCSDLQSYAIRVAEANSHREYSRLADRTTEFLWQQGLQGLRTQVQKKPSAPSNPLHVIGDVNLPDKVQEELKCRPKFAVEPRRTSPELLGLVRHVSKRFPEGDVDRCASEGVDLLMRVRPPKGSFAIPRTIKHLKGNSLAQLPVDKDGGFAVMR